MIIYVMISGIHGSAWTAVVKDIMVLGVAIFLGIFPPIALYGGFQPMFEQIVAEKGPQFLVFGGDYPISWFISSVLLSALSFYMWPHTFGAALTAQNGKVFRRNAIIMPLYQLILLFIFFVGFAAILAVPGLKGADGDLALLKVSIQEFNPWLVGIIGAAGLLTALVPGSLLLMVSATLLVKNVYGVFRPSATDTQIARYAKFVVPVVGLAALYFTLSGGQSIVLLLLLGYSLVTQVFPALLLSVLPNGQDYANKYGAAAGIVVGVATVVYFTATESTVGDVLPWLPQGLDAVHVGIIGLILNTIVLFAVSLATRNFAGARSGERTGASPRATG